MHFERAAARKILLRSEPAGVGVCFESTPLDPVLAESDGVPVPQPWLFRCV